MTGLLPGDLGVAPSAGGASASGRLALDLVIAGIRPSQIAELTWRDLTITDDGSAIELRVGATGHNRPHSRSWGSPSK